MECVSGFVNTAVHRGGAQVEPWGSAGGMASVALASGALYYLLLGGTFQAGCREGVGAGALCPSQALGVQAWLAGPQK